MHQSEGTTTFANALEDIGVAFDWLQTSDVVDRYGVDTMLVAIGGWEDTQVTIDQIMLPLYRALKEEGAEQVAFLVYHDDHAFARVRNRLADDIGRWLLQQASP